MAFPAADIEAPPRARFAATLARGWGRMAAAFESYPIERIGLAAVAAGVVLRLLVPFIADFRSDGDTYTAMGQAWSLHHAFLMPYGDVTTWGPLPPGYSNHYPPAYPFYLGLVFSVFGFGLLQAKAAAVVMSLAALGAVYLCTRDLYGPDRAALLAGLFALEPNFIWATGTGFSENMVLLFFALTMWAIMRSLKDDRYILYAGLFAGLAYLTRSSVGYFFLIAGAGGFLWRFYYRRWKLFTNVWYMGAVVIFLALAGSWAYRNASLFPAVTQTFHLGALGAYTVTLPAWETSSYIRYVQGYALDRPGEWWDALVRKIPWFTVFLLWWVLPFLPEAWRATKKIKAEDTSALWLSIALVWITAWIISGMFTVFEHVDFISNNHRYVIIGLLPLGWLIFREARLERASTRFRVILLMLSLFAWTGATLMDPVRYSDLRAAEFMDPYLHGGDSVAVDGGTIKYAFYAYLTHPEQIRVFGYENAPSPCVGEPWAESASVAFIVTLCGSKTYDGFDLAGTFRQKFSDGGVMTTLLWARHDLVEPRGIPLNVVKDYD